MAITPFKDIQGHRLYIHQKLVAHTQRETQKTNLWYQSDRRLPTLHYIIKLFIAAKVKNCKVHYVSD